MTETMEPSDSAQRGERPQQSFSRRYISRRGGFMAAVLAAAMLAGFVFSRGPISLKGPAAVNPSPTPVSAVIRPCLPQEVTLTGFRSRPGARPGCWGDRRRVLSQQRVMHSA